MLALPFRLVLAVLVNLLLAPRNLVRWLARRPAWITVRIDGPVAERPPRRRFRLGSRERTLSIAGLESLGRAVARDRAARGIVLEIDHVAAGWARLESLRGVIAGWRAAGIRVVAHLSAPGNRELFLASACDEVIADPSGPVALTGLLAEVDFLGEALRRVGIDPELDHLGEYKSFAETFTRSEMSPAHRESLDAVLDGIEHRFLEAIAAGRRTDVEHARTLVDEGPYLVEDALGAGLLDAIRYRDELPEHLEPGAKRKPRLVQHDRWLASRVRWWLPRLRARRVVAVLSLEGSIVGGEGTDFPQRACGADSSVRALATLRESPRVAAVVLHVDSRGGSASASDRIWREVSRLAAAKPVVAFFGDAAASGGYYLAAPATAIVAQPTTLTGSIGVVAGKVAIERLLDRLGVGTAVLTRGRAAAMMSLRRRYDDDGRARLRRELDGVYRQFLDRVEQGRRMPRAQVEDLARGRVWIGADAAERGLVDRLGGCAQAIEVAKEKARRGPEERLAIRDFHPVVRHRSLLRGLAGGASAAGVIEDACMLLDRLTSERIWLFAPDLPRVG